MALQCFLCEINLGFVSRNAIHRLCICIGRQKKRIDLLPQQQKTDFFTTPKIKRDGFSVLKWKRVSCYSAESVQGFPSWRPMPLPRPPVVPMARCLLSICVQKKICGVWFRFVETIEVDVNETHLTPVLSLGFSSGEWIFAGIDCNQNSFLCANGCCYLSVWRRALPSMLSCLTMCLKLFTHILSPLKHHSWNAIAWSPF